MNGANILRVHDVKEAVQAITLFERYRHAGCADGRVPRGMPAKKSNLTDCLSNLSSQYQKIGNYLFIMTKPDTLTV